MPRQQYLNLEVFEVEGLVDLLNNNFYLRLAEIFPNEHCGDVIQRYYESNSWTGREINAYLQKLNAACEQDNNDAARYFTEFCLPQMNPQVKSKSAVPGLKELTISNVAKICIFFYLTQDREAPAFLEEVCDDSPEKFLGILDSVTVTLKLAQIFTTSTRRVLENKRAYYEGKYATTTRTRRSVAPASLPSSAPLEASAVTSSASNNNRVSSAPSLRKNKRKKSVSESKDVASSSTRAPRNNTSASQRNSTSPEGRVVIVSASKDRIGLATPLTRKKRKVRTTEQKAVAPPSPSKAVAPSSPSKAVAPSSPSKAVASPSPSKAVAPSVKLSPINLINRSIADIKTTIIIDYDRDYCLEQADIRFKANNFVETIKWLYGGLQLGLQSINDPDEAKRPSEFWLDNVRIYILKVFMRVLYPDNIDQESLIGYGYTLQEINEINPKLKSKSDELMRQGAINSPGLAPYYSDEVMVFIAELFWGISLDYVDKFANKDDGFFESYLKAVCLISWKLLFTDLAFYISRSSVMSYVKNLEIHTQICEKILNLPADKIPLKKNDDGQNVHDFYKRILEGYRAKMERRLINSRILTGDEDCGSCPPELVIFLAIRILSDLRVINQQGELTDFQKEYKENALSVFTQLREQWDQRRSNKDLGDVSTFCRLAAAYLNPYLQAHTLLNCQPLLFFYLKVVPVFGDERHKHYCKHLMDDYKEQIGLNIKRRYKDCIEQQSDKTNSTAVVSSKGSAAGTLTYSDSTDPNNSEIKKRKIRGKLVRASKGNNSPASSGGGASNYLAFPLPSGYGTTRLTQAPLMSGIMPRGAGYGYGYGYGYGGSQQRVYPLGPSEYSGYQQNYVPLVAENYRRIPGFFPGVEQTDPGPRNHPGPSEYSGSQQNYVPLVPEHFERIPGFFPRETPTNPGSRNHPPQQPAKGILAASSGASFFSQAPPTANSSGQSMTTTSGPSAAFFPRRAPSLSTADGGGFELLYDLGKTQRN
jgi:hypothetical protein